MMSECVKTMNLDYKLSLMIYYDIIDKIIFGNEGFIMTVLEYESYKCPDCKRDFADPADVKDWKCPYCDDTIWIIAVVDDNQYVLERIKAKDIQKEDVILFRGDSYGIDVKKVKHFGKKVRIYLRGNMVLNENPETFFNIMIGIWQPSDES